MRIIESSNRRAVGRLIDRQRQADPAVARRVARIVREVRRAGDAAALRYARRFDNLAAPVEVTAEEMRDGLRATAPELRTALRAAARHIRRVARRQIPRAWRASVTPGVDIEQRVTPLERVGCYVPAGRYPLPSSLLMTVIPARVAGVPEVIVACPRPDPTVLAAASIAGATRLFRLGGAHAVAAVALEFDFAVFGCTARSAHGFELFGKRSDIPIWKGKVAHEGDNFALLAFLKGDHGALFFRGLYGSAGCVLRAVR